MTKAEITSEIQKALENVPEKVLHDILVMLKSLQSKPSDQIEISHAFRQILSEDMDLLAKLAK